MSAFGDSKGANVNSNSSASAAADSSTSGADGAGPRDFCSWEQGKRRQEGRERETAKGTEGETERDRPPPPHTHRHTYTLLKLLRAANAEKRVSISRVFFPITTFNTPQKKKHPAPSSVHYTRHHHRCNQATPLRTCSKLWTRTTATTTTIMATHSRIGVRKLALLSSSSFSSLFFFSNFFYTFLPPPHTLSSPYFT